jgi:hypothetical protein
MHINDNEHGLHADYERWLEELAPHAPVSQYQHNRTGEDNADAHLKRQIMGREVVVAVTNGRLDFGTWERFFQGQAERLARESRRAPSEAGVGQDHWGVGAPRAIPAVIEYGTSTIWGCYSELIQFRDPDRSAEMVRLDR